MGIVKKIAMGGLALAALAIRGKKPTASAQPREDDKASKELPAKAQAAKEQPAKQGARKPKRSNGTRKKSSSKRRGGQAKHV